MSDAYQCERCDEYHDGSGTEVRVGRYPGRKGFTNQYDFWKEEEVCDDCWDEFTAVVDEFFKEDSDA